MFLLFLILGLGNCVRWPDKKWWAVDVGSFVGQQKQYLRAENVASYGGVYKYKYTLTKDKLTIGEVWDAFKAVKCKGVLANSRFFVVARACYDKKAFSKNDVAKGEIFVRYGAFSQIHDGRFEQIGEIRIQYFHVVLKAKGEFIISVYSKPAEMMTWDEQTKNVWNRRENKRAIFPRCVIVGPLMIWESDLDGFNKQYPNYHPKNEIHIQNWGMNAPRMYKDFKGKTEVYWQTDERGNAIFPQLTDEGAPAYCFIFGTHPIKWKLFGFVAKRGDGTRKLKNGKTTNNVGVIESIYREFVEIMEEKPEFFEYAKPIWEEINENMIDRKELRQEL
ncbi:unnamed protein product [Oikopleura dioica]|uniref:Uncharacterized protein n=1 Tax=Oikopleura dioica TaxID=34765 RepID=E4Y071_OIKDI|nr:unnamed protein product [Oikopleura dioica]